MLHYRRLDFDLLWGYCGVPAHSVLAGANLMDLGELEDIPDLDVLEAAIRPDTALVSIMTVNNETGVIQPIREIGALVRKHRGVYFHTDAAQAAGKIPIDVNEMNIDLLSMSGHKIYGPKGVGVAYVRRRPRVRLEPIISGGGQERGLRSGTLATALVVGIGEAARIAKQEMAVSLLPHWFCDETLHALSMFSNASCAATAELVSAAGTARTNVQGY